MNNMFKVRDGYVWIGPDGKPTTQRQVSEKDPGFKSQRHKLEKIEPPKKATEPDGSVAEPTGAPSNRMAVPPQGRKAK